VSESAGVMTIADHVDPAWALRILRRDLEEGGFYGLVGDEMLFRGDLDTRVDSGYSRGTIRVRTRTNGQDVDKWDLRLDQPDQFFIRTAEIVREVVRWARGRVAGG